MVEIANQGRHWNPADYPVQRLFNEYFGVGMNSIVFQELREARGLAYSASGSYRMPSKKEDTEGFFDFIATQNDKMMDCISTFREIIDTIPMSSSAFEIAKQNLMKSIESERITRFEMLRIYWKMQRLGITESMNKKLYEALPTLTLDDIVRFERENIVGKPRLRLILGNKDELDISALEKLGPVKYVTTEEIFGE